MAPASALHVYLVLVFLSALRGESRYLEVKSSPEEEDFLHISPDWKRELSEGHIYRRSLRCIDMLSLEGQFTFTAQQPALHCALFFIGDPEDLITIEYDFVNIDCRGGDFLKVFDGWILKGEKFPSSLDHPLSTPERYTDYCAHADSHRIYRSSQNVAMIFFRVQEPGNGFTVTIRKMTNLFPCNVISQTPNGRFTMVIPHLHRNCSFSIIYPVVIKISDVALGHLSELQLKDSGGKSCSLLHLNHLSQNCSQATTLASTRNPPIGCNGVGDFVELLGGAGLDPSKMFPLADLCHSFHGPARMKIGCDNTVVRMVSSGKFVNRVTFEYNQLDRRNDLEESGQGNSVEEVCFPTD